jgi:hypothetical protein
MFYTTGPQIAKELRDVLARQRINREVLVWKKTSSA